MTSRLVALCIDANDPARLARFWAGVLDREVTDEGDGPGILSPADTGFRIRFLPTDAPKTDANQMHVDLTSVSLEDQQRTVVRSLDLGGRHLDIGQGPDAAHVVLADPEGNEFCVIEPGNRFLAGCGSVGALSSDGSQEVGYFWSAALGWPLVWDQDGETAIQSPQGGSKITWGGPPVRPRSGRNRLRFDLAPIEGGDLQQEVDRLVGLGATRIGDSSGGGRLTMADPDGNEFDVLTTS